MDNITAKETEHGSYQYNYDDLYRLTTVDNPVQDDEAFSYDGVGNRLTAEGTTGNWIYNQNNELSGYDGTSYVYDDNGNMIQKTVAGTVTNYVYNVEDRLTQVWTGDVGTGTLVASYYYDPFGRRLWKEVSGTKMYFHYADEGLIGEYDSTGAEIKTYGYKPGSTWTTDPLFIKVGTEHYFYHNDHLGTPQKLTGVNGAVVWSAKYNSFGEATIEVNTVENNLRFPGQYEDGESGLYYNFNRYYDPSIGRYLRVDPIGFSGGNHLFLYANDNPINFIDPKGLKAKCNPYNEAHCRIDCANKHRTFKSCFQKDCGDKWQVTCNCGPKWTEEHPVPEPPKDKPQPPPDPCTLACMRCFSGKFWEKGWCVVCFLCVPLGGM